LANNRYRASLALLTSLALAAVKTDDDPLSAIAEVIPHPRIYQLGIGGVPGWKVTAIRISRRESNWRAWNDSRPEPRYFYRGSWRTLGRVTGWFEILDLSRGHAEGEAVVLTSEFPTVAQAERAYHSILPHATRLVSLAIGAHATEWQTSPGVASGSHGLAGYFGTFTTFLQAGSVVVEIDAYVGGKRGQVLRPPLLNPGRAIAGRISLIAASALS
jgi:hypothetical protein